MKHNTFHPCAKFPHFVSLLIFPFSQRIDKLSIQISHRPYGSLFHQVNAKCWLFVKLSKIEDFHPHWPGNFAALTGTPPGACCQGRAWEALISSSVGCRLIWLIGDLSLEVQHHGPAVPRQVRLALRALGRGEQGPTTILGQRWWVAGRGRLGW